MPRNFQVSRGYHFAFDQRSSYRREFVNSKSSFEIESPLNRLDDSTVILRFLTTGADGKILVPLGEACPIRNVILKKNQ